MVRPSPTPTLLLFTDHITDLTPDARVLYSSDSIVDVLGWTPDEVVNRSCWEFFCEDELPFAQAFHKKGVQMDKAAVLSYCRVRNKEGQWTGVECCFTVVYDVMIVCTSIYRRGLPSQSRCLPSPPYHLPPNTFRRTSRRSPYYTPLVLIITTGSTLSHVVAYFRQV